MCVWSIIEMGLGRWVESRLIDAAQEEDWKGRMDWMEWRGYVGDVIARLGGTVRCDSG